MVKVSVVIPVYNLEEFIRNCLDSVVSQTLKEIEIICVNDASNDRSLEILEEYSKKDNRIRIVNQKRNSGLSAVRNVGAKEAAGEFIYFLDGDDLIVPEALNSLYHRACADDLDILYFNAMPFFQDEDLEERHKHYHSYYRRNNFYKGVKSGKKLLSEMVLNDDWKPAVWLQFYKKDFYRNAQLSFHEGIYHEDNLFSFHAALRAMRVGYDPEAFFRRRIRHDSIMTMKKNWSHFYGYLTCYMEMLNLCSSVDIDSCFHESIVGLVFKVFKNALGTCSDINENEAMAQGSYSLSLNQKITMEILIRHEMEIKKRKEIEKKHLKIKADLSSQKKINNILEKENSKLEEHSEKVICELKTTENKFNEIKTSKAYRFGLFFANIYNFLKRPSWVKQTSLDS